MSEVDPAFLAFLQQEEMRAYDGSLMDEVDAALKSYNGEAYGDEEEGRSQVVARDVAETTDYMLTSILDPFVASGRVVEFEATDQADDQLADDATEALHYLYRRKSGFRLIHDWGKAGLLEKIAVVKTCVERKRKRVDALYHPAMLPDNAIEAQPAMQPHPETGEQVPMLHPADGTPMIQAVTLEETAATFPDYFVPLEEFRVAPDARDLDSAVYLCHLTEKSLSDLVEMGFDPEVVDTVQGDNPIFTDVQITRNDGRSVLVNDRQGALRKVWLREEYVLYDLNGDGLAERLCVHRVGNTFLEVEEADYQPFEYWCPYPMQGRLIGQSLADKTMDIQRVNTVLERLMLDSAYQQVAPGTFIHDDSCNEHTLDDLLTVRPNRLVRFKGNQPPIPEERVNMSDTALRIIEFKTRQRESRTGITALNKGVDENTLNETASGQAMLMTRGQQMERYVLRQFGEGVARLFMKKIGLLRKFGQPFQIRVDGQYRQVDPRQWPEEMEVNVRVGLGSGSKQERIQYRQMIGQVQSLLKESGSPIVSDDNLYNNAAGMARDMGFPPNDMFSEPPKDAQGNPVPQQQPPDPKVMALMAQVQVKQQAIEAQRQSDAMKLQQMAAQHADQTQLEMLRQHQEAAIAVREQNLQTWLDQQEMILEAHKHAAQLDSQQKIAKMRPGGKLDK